MKAMLILLAAVLTGCQSRPAGTGAVSASRLGMGKDSWYGMCELNHRIMSARTPEERQAILDRDMPNMSQEARERHLRMMQQSCQQ